MTTHDYPPEWDNEPTWIVCPSCKGYGCVRDDFDLDMTCFSCDGEGGREL